MRQEKRSKRKSKAHLVDRKANSIIESLLPVHWTIREYKPDYGIDLSIELFESKKNIKGEIVYDTLGEHIFIQVKGTSSPNFSKHRIYEKHNVEKKLAASKKYKEIDVIKFQLDTNELFTIDRMSNAVPVLLFIVDVDTNQVYFLCLNDYIDKILVPSDSNYYQKQNKTIYIPTANRITEDETSLYPLMFYGKRAKYYSFFNKCRYQQHELQYLDEDSLMATYPFFLEILLRFDIWDQSHLWGLLEHYHKELIKLKNRGADALLEDFYDIPDEKDNSEWETNFSGNRTYTQKETLVFMQVRSLWDKLSILSNTYEEICREAFLPSYFWESVNS